MPRAPPAICSQVLRRWLRQAPISHFYPRQKGNINPPWTLAGPAALFFTAFRREHPAAAVPRPTICLTLSEIATREFLSRCPRGGSEKLHPDHLIVFVEVENRAGAYLFRFDDPLFVQAKVEGVVFPIDFDPHVCPSMSAKSADASKSMNPC